MVPGITRTPKPLASPLAIRRYICLACRRRDREHRAGHKSTAAVDGRRLQVASSPSANLLRIPTRGYLRKSSFSTSPGESNHVGIKRSSGPAIRRGRIGAGLFQKDYVREASASPVTRSRTYHTRCTWADAPCSASALSSVSSKLHLAISPRDPNGRQRRVFTSQRVLAQRFAIAPQSAASPQASFPSTSASSPIRAQLLHWQLEHEKVEGDGPLPQLQETTQSTHDEDHEQSDELANIPDEEGDGSVVDTFLRMGDLVEIMNAASGMFAPGIFIRKTSQANLNQIYTTKGQLIHVKDSFIPYSIPGFVSPEEVEPMLEFIPAVDATEEEMATIRQTAYFYDISVPREVSAPLIRKLVQFQNQAKVIYRDHAETLDSAHDLLAHQTDLQYSSLRATASNLLSRDSSRLTDAELYAVHQALRNAGFGFGFDNRSRRSTGHLQIRSKAQVRNLEQVKHWVHAWQDDVARRANLRPYEREKASKSHTAQIIYTFIEKARTAIVKSREDRQPLTGGLGPSKTSFPLEPGSSTIRELDLPIFSGAEIRIIEFIEAWCLAKMFRSDLSLESLVPALLSATGLYHDIRIDAAGGLIFLAELGVIPPYVNRATFDPSLLLPASQLGGPLQRLAVRLSGMRKDTEFKDSMAHLRRDWADLTVFCIDSADAAEIDDGVSLEDAGPGADGKATYWVHVHIANPTAFFRRDHPIAQMSRHLGETVYMPEKSYNMMPPWASKEHFSLEKDRPCLTFSTLMDEDGRPIERAITPGIVRIVKSITPHDVEDIVVEQKTQGIRPYLLTIGGAIPPPQTRSNGSSTLTPADKAQLSKLRDLTYKLLARRKAAGGLTYDQSRPECIVRNETDRPGLGWWQVRRSGGRHILGDPAIQAQVQPLRNWFEPVANPGDELVREVMLLACETAAQWCHERKIPGLFRGTSPRPGQSTSPEMYYNEVLAPAAEKHDGRYPLELGLGYLGTFGGTIMSTEAIKHRILGMSAYAKVTSPLRRYGDMIMHWQIEAALRHEANTKQSLVTDRVDPARTFLPFSATALEAIMVGLKARERLISGTKMYSNLHWFAHLLFRAHHFGAQLDTHVTAGVPSPESMVTLQRLPEVVHVHVVNGSSHDTPLGTVVEFDGVLARIVSPVGEGPRYRALAGDVWQVRFSNVDTYSRSSTVELIQLVYRIGEDGYDGWLGNGPPLELAGRS